jgi:hypothetical protein
MDTSSASAILVTASMEGIISPRSYLPMAGPLVPSFSASSHHAYQAAIPGLVSSTGCELHDDPPERDRAYVKVGKRTASGAGFCRPPLSLVHGNVP